MYPNFSDGELQSSIVIELLTVVLHVWSHACDTISYTDNLGPDLSRAIHL